MARADVRAVLVSVTVQLFGRIYALLIAWPLTPMPWEGELELVIISIYVPLSRHN